jgi:hypothetical protein
VVDASADSTEARVKEVLALIGEDPRAYEASAVLQVEVRLRLALSSAAPSLPHPPSAFILIAALAFHMLVSREGEEGPHRVSGEIIQRLTAENRWRQLERYAGEGSARPVQIICNILCSAGWASRGPCGRPSGGPRVEHKKRRTSEAEPEKPEE